MRISERSVGLDANSGGACAKIRISLGLRLLDVPAPVEIHDPGGRVIGIAGWSEARKGASIIFVANGVVVERIDEKRWRSSFVALVEADDLARDVSLSKLRRDDAFHAQVAAIQAVHDALPSNDQAESVHARAQRINAFGLGWIASFAFMTLVVLASAAGFMFLGSAGIVASSVITLVYGALAPLVWRDALRSEQIHAHGLEGVATFMKVSGSNKAKLLIQLPDRAPYEVTIGVAGFASEVEIARGPRVFVLVDPRDPKRLELACGSAHAPKALGPSQEN